VYFFTYYEDFKNTVGLHGTSLNLIAFAHLIKVQPSPWRFLRNSQILNNIMWKLRYNHLHNKPATAVHPGQICWRAQQKKKKKKKKKEKKGKRRYNRTYVL
jgi:hypothetical protein